MAKQFALTTSDNPWNPITHFSEWYKYDTKVLHHDTCSYLAQIAHVCGSLSEEDYDETVMKAMIEIVSFNFVGLITNGEVNYKIVFG